MKYQKVEIKTIDDRVLIEEIVDCNVVSIFTNGHQQMTIAKDGNFYIFNHCDLVGIANDCIIIQGLNSNESAGCFIYLY